jgi:outer membrane biosynthesis protein TonB
MKISPSCIQGFLALALSCFVLGFVFQVIFQSIPSEHAKNIDFQFNPAAVADLNSNSLAAPPVTPLLRQNKPSTDVASHIDQPPPPPPVQRAENHPTPGSDGYYHEAEVPQIVKAWRSIIASGSDLERRKRKAS